MRNFKIFMYILVSFFFASCGEIYVNMDNVEYSVDKNVCKENEPIEINFKGHFYPQDEVSGVWIRITLYKNNNENNESCEMNIISRNNDTIDWTDKSYRYYSHEDEKYRFIYLLEEKNMTNFDERIEISIPYEGEYRLLLSTRAESLVRYKGGLNDSSKQILVIK